MKTYKVTRVETIRETQFVEAKNKDEAIDKMHYENWDDAVVLKRLKIKINFECTHADKKETEMELEKIIHYHIYEKIWNIDPKGVKLDVKEIAPKGYCRSCKQMMKLDEISRQNEEYCISCY